jgi:hypothetical protein
MKGLLTPACHSHSTFQLLLLALISHCLWRGLLLLWVENASYSFLWTWTWLWLWFWFWLWALLSPPLFLPLTLLPLLILTCLLLLLLPYITSNMQHVSLSIVGVKHTVLIIGGPLSLTHFLQAMPCIHLPQVANMPICLLTWLPSWQPFLLFPLLLIDIHIIHTLWHL